jgi:hypothetical protein
MNFNVEPFGSGSARIIFGGGRDDLRRLAIDDVKELYKHAGVLIFRGFDFDPWLMKSFAEQFSTRFNRDRVRPPLEGTDGFVQMVDEGMGYAHPHCEQANSPFRPDAIWFCCMRPACAGGETLFWDGIRLLQSLSADIVRLFEGKQLRFFQRYSPDKWALFLGEGACLDDVRRTLDGLPGTSYFIAEDRSLYLEYVCPPVVKTRYGDCLAFANSLLSERANTLGELMTFSDGSAIPEAAIRDIDAAMEGIKEQISWHPGDLAFIDNSRFLHGRNAFTDKDRRIYSTLSFLNF